MDAFIFCRWPVRRWVRLLLYSQLLFLNLKRSLQWSNHEIHQNDGA